jgi:hypothetical protein
LAASRWAAPVSSLATISSTSMRPEPKGWPFKEGAGHGHDLALVHFVLEHAAFNHRGLDLGVEDGHQAQRLHHVRAVVAAQAHVDLEVEVATISGL